MDRGGVGEQRGETVPVEPGTEPEGERDPRLRPAEVTRQQRAGPQPRRSSARKGVAACPRRRSGSGSSRTTGSPSAIAASAAASSAGDVLPAPVAATTKPSAPAACNAEIGVPSVATVAATRKTRSAARSAATRRRGPRAAASSTSPSTTRPSEPRFSARNVSKAEACVLVTSSAASIVPSRTTTAPTSASRTAARRGHPDGRGQVGRTVVARLARGAHRAGDDDRLRAVVEQVEEERRLLDRVRSLDDDGAVDGRVRQRRRRRSAAIPNNASKVKWLAGVRPRSIGTRSAIAASPGTVSSSAAPPSTGTLPPATGSRRMLIVPPVNTIAIRAMVGSLRPAGGGAARSAVSSVGVVGVDRHLPGQLVRVERRLGGRDRIGRWSHHRRQTRGGTAPSGQSGMPSPSMSG